MFSRIQHNCFFLSLPETKTQSPFHFLGIIHFNFVQMKVETVMNPPSVVSRRVGRVSLSCTPHWTFLREGPGKDSSTNPSSKKCFWVIQRWRTTRSWLLYRVYRHTGCILMANRLPLAILCPVNG